MKKIKIKAWSLVINMMAHDTNTEVDNSILIVGSARSGTTFLMESINSHNDYRLIFEPFNATYTASWSGYSSRHFVDPERISDKDVSAILDILKGKVHNKWTDQFNQKIKADKRLIKAVRANLLVPIIRKIAPNMSIIYIVRSIYEVVASRMKLEFEDELSAILAHKEFVNQYYRAFNVMDLKERTSTIAGRHALMWVLENKFLVERAEKFDLLMLQYNDVKGRSIDYEDGEITISNTKNNMAPSYSTSNKAPIKFTSEERDEINYLLGYFEIDEYCQLIGE